MKLELAPAEEIAALQLQIQDLMDQLAALQKRYDSLVYRYGQEVEVNIRLVDVLREHRINWR